MVSLLIAPLLEGKKSWSQWWLGIPSFVIFVVVTGILMYKKVLTWEDPLSVLDQA